MKKFKKFLLCIVVFLISFTMFGCAQVKFDTVYALRQDSAGNEYAIVTANMKIQLTTSTYWTRVNPIIKEYYNQLNNAYVNNLVNLYSNVYDFNALDTSENKTQYDETQEKYDYILKQNLNKFLVIYENDNDKEEFKTDPQNQIITIRKEFISIYGYIMYFYPDAFKYDENTNNVVISDSYKSMVDIPLGGSFEEDNSLFIKNYIQSCSPFYYNGKEPVFLEDDVIVGVSAGQKLTDVIISKTGQQNVDLIFSFSTPYKRVHSDGVLTQTENSYTHTWTLDGIDGSVTLWRSYANSIAWYVVAGITGLAILIIGCIVIFIIKNKKKKDGMKALKKLDELSRNQSANKK